MAGAKLGVELEELLPPYGGISGNGLVPPPLPPFPPLPLLPPAAAAAAAPGDSDLDLFGLLVKSCCKRSAMT